MFAHVHYLARTTSYSSQQPPNLHKIHPQYHPHACTRIMRTFCHPMPQYFFAIFCLLSNRHPLVMAATPLAPRALGSTAARESTSISSPHIYKHVVKRWGSGATWARQGECVCVFVLDKNVFSTRCSWDGPHSTSEYALTNHITVQPIKSRTQRTHARRAKPILKGRSTFAKLAQKTFYAFFVPRRSMADRGGARARLGSCGRDCATKKKATLPSIWRGAQARKHSRDSQVDMTSKAENGKVKTGPSTDKPTSVVRLNDYFASVALVFFCHPFFGDFLVRQNKVKSTDPDPYMDKKTPVYALQSIYFGKNIRKLYMQVGIQDSLVWALLFSDTVERL